MGTDRNQRGQFVAGHPAYKNGGRKPRETERRYLDLLRGCVSEADAREIVKAAIEQAKKRDGHMERKWLFDYLAGPPVQRVAPTDPSGENEYHPIDVDQLTDEQVAQLAAIIAGPKPDSPGAAEA